MWPLSLAGHKSALPTHSFVPSGPIEHPSQFSCAILLHVLRCYVVCHHIHVSHPWSTVRNVHFDPGSLARGVLRQDKIARIFLVKRRTG